ncbi:protein panoramix isoform X2 [Drosophila innubila]|uniref:protein panoramix isoform X2 n=1 Tax=Drosophila innubila TaxID=198719 RepID=UPI00148BB1EC|nr:protein panoramix isoform X2 [Drosophila innubila]
MENQINAKNGSGQDVKREPEPSSIKDNENTPLRDEKMSSPDPKIVNLSDSEWDSDDKNPASAPDPFSSRSANFMRIKESPTFDDQQATPPRFSNTADEEDNLDNMLDSLMPELDAVPERPITPSFNLKRMERSPRFDDPSTPQRTSNAADNEEDNLQSLSNVDNMLESLPPELDAAPEPPSPPSINLNSIKRSPRFDDPSTQQTSNALDDKEKIHESQSNVDNILESLPPELDAAPEPPSPPSINLNRIKRSPRFDDPSTPQTTSNASDDKEDNLESQLNVDNILESLPPKLDAAPEPPSPPSISLNRIKRSPRFDDPSSHSGISITHHEHNHFESHPNDNMMSDAPENHLNDELEVKLKKEELEDLHLDFLDSLSEADLGNVDTVKQEPSTNEIDEELRTLMEAHNQLKEKLERKQHEKSKKKKHKKEKKRKRERSQSGSPSRSQSTERSHKQRRSNEISSISASRITVKAEAGVLDYLPVQDCEKSIKIINLNKLMPSATGAGASPPPTLTIMEKRKLAVERVKAVLHSIRLKSSNAPESEFLVVDTVRKLPSSELLMSSAIYENPSPLSNNFNVTYKFNSTTKSNIDLSKWGLEAMPAVTAKLLRITGIDVTRLMELKENSQMSLHKIRLQQEAEKAAIKTEDECISTGLFRSLSTQTDGRLVNCTKDVAVQTKPTSQQGIFWLDSQFSESDLSQQHANVMYALKELCATKPSSVYWADAIFNALHNALKIKREEVKQLTKKKTYY